MTTRKGDGFRFPNQKYDDSKALYTNFRYMQEYLNRIWANSKGAPDVIVAPVDGIDPARADLKCDGENDDVTIAEAVSMLPTNGGWVHLMAGTFTFGSSCIPNGGRVLITGAGRADQEDESHGGTRITSASNIALFNALNCDLFLKDIDLDGNNAALHGVTQGSEFNDVYLENVSARRFTSHGVSMGRTGSVFRASSCLFSNNGASGLNVSECEAFVYDSVMTHNTNHGVTANYGGNVRMFVNCLVANNSGHGFETGGLDGAGYGIVLVGSHVANNGLNGISWPGNPLGAPQSVIVGNRIINNTNNSVHVGEDSVVVGNIFAGNGTNPPVAGAGSVVYGNVGDAGIDHGGLNGLGDDDHTIYFTSGRHDAHDHSSALASTVLNDIGNVNASPSNGQVLKWNGSQWIAGDDSAGSGGSESFHPFLLMGA